MAELAVSYAVVLARELGIEVVLTPNTSRYCAQISARPAFQKALAT